MMYGRRIFFKTFPTQTGYTPNMFLFPRSVSNKTKSLFGSRKNYVVEYGSSDPMGYTVY